MKNLRFLLITMILSSCASVQNSRKLSERAYYDWSVSYDCGKLNLKDYYDPNQRLCKFWEIMDQGDYLFAETFIEGMKQDKMDQRLIDLVTANLALRRSNTSIVKEIAEKYSNDEAFYPLRVLLGVEKKFDRLGEYNQMELLAKVKGNLRIGMAYEAWKLLKALARRTRDPWYRTQIRILKNRKKGDKI